MVMLGWKAGPEQYDPVELLNQAIESNAKIGSPIHFSEVNFNQAFPFESTKFDFVSCCFAIYYAENIPYTISEMRRVLKPGGSIYVGIENRYAYGYFMGAQDHNRLRYTSILPRPRICFKS